ncbi:MAG: DMT family transporter [Clostridia bacterium]|nr:DMT family transporter [Clostridia bacterium]
MQLLSALPHLREDRRHPRGTLAPSDGALLVGAVFWAMHILVTDHFVTTVRPLRLCLIQFATGALLNWIFAFLTEDMARQDILGGLWAVAYCGILSTGVGYTLQTVGQKDCHPALAALILCLESVFCVIAGALMLGEKMTAWGYTGCILMLAAVVIAQGGALFKNRKAKKHV